jgi:hypothetical protein
VEFGARNGGVVVVLALVTAASGVSARGDSRSSVPSSSLQLQSSAIAKLLLAIAREMETREEENEGEGERLSATG